MSVRTKVAKRKKNQSQDDKFASGKLNVRLVTEQTIANLIEKSRQVWIVRSGLYGKVGTCVETIRRVCAQADHPKVIHMILPSLWNPDVDVRARAMGKSVIEVRALLNEWHESLAALSQELAREGKHVLELRTTLHPHRYHAFIGDDEAIVGFAWHRKAALHTTSLAFDAETSDPYAMANFAPDFEWLWDEGSMPYTLGDNKKFKSRPEQKDSVISKLVAKWGRAHHKLLAALKSVKSLQNHYGSGVTADQVAHLLKGDSNTWNKRLLRLEQDGLLRKIKVDKDSNTYGRVLTGVGLLALPEIERMVPSTALQL